MSDTAPVHTTAVTPDAEIPDELDEYIAEQTRNPAFAQWWHWISATLPGKLPIDGREYHRRQVARRRRDR